MSEVFFYKEKPAIREMRGRLRFRSGPPEVVRVAEVDERGVAEELGHQVAPVRVLLGDAGEAAREDFR
jgi:hypothetical protein